VRDQLQELKKEGHITIEKFNNYAEDFDDTCIECSQEWCLPFLMSRQRVDWINLQGKVSWKSVQVNCVFMKTVVPDFSLNADDLFHEFSCVQKCCESKLEVWNEKNDQNVTEKLCEMLAHSTKENIYAVNIKCLISFCLALPGYNAPIERGFSIRNVLRSDEKNRLKIETVKALTIVKTHFKDVSCSEFFPQISKGKVFLEQIHKSDKQLGESGKAFAE
jgi:hypothetical protein